MPAVDEPAAARPRLRLGGAWMFIAGPNISRATAIVQRCSSSDGRGASAIRVPGFGAEILDDDFLDVAVALVQLAQRQQRLDALAPRLADADQDAGGERHALLRPPPQSWRGARPGTLSGEPKCGPPRSRQPLATRLQHDALRDRDLAQRRDRPRSSSRRD